MNKVSRLSIKLQCLNTRKPIHQKNRLVEAVLLVSGFTVFRATDLLQITVEQCFSTIL